MTVLLVAVIWYQRREITRLRETNTYLRESLRRAQHTILSGLT